MHPDNESMDLRRNMLDACERYCEATGRKPSTVATLIMNDGKFFNRLRSGGDFQLGTYERVMKWFAENAPAQRGAA